MKIVKGYFATSAKVVSFFFLLFLLLWRSRLFGAYFQICFRADFPPRFFLLVGHGEKRKASVENAGEIEKHTKRAGICNQINWQMDPDPENGKNIVKSALYYFSPHSLFILYPLPSSLYFPLPVSLSTFFSLFVFLLIFVSSVKY